MLAELWAIGYRVECWWVEFGEGGMGILAVKTFLESIDPAEAIRIEPTIQNKEIKKHIVFQLNRPSYEMLRRCGSFVKSTLLVSCSRPTKYSSKLGVSRESVAKTNPLRVKWVLISRF